MGQVVDSARLNTLLDTFDQGVQNNSLNNVTQLQAQFLRQWLTSDSIGSLEVVLRSAAFIDPVANKSYVTVLGALLVRIRLPLVCRLLTGHEASAKQRERGQLQLIRRYLHFLTTKFSTSARTTLSHSLQSTPISSRRTLVSRLVE